MRCPRCNCAAVKESKTQVLAIFVCGSYVYGESFTQSKACEADAKVYRRKLLEAAAQKMDRRIRQL